MPVSWFVSKSLCKRKISIIFRRVRSQIDSTEVVSHGRNGRETRKLDWKGCWQWNFKKEDEKIRK